MNTLLRRGLAAVIAALWILPALAAISPSAVE